jgi:hypothetical protein
MDSSTLPTLTVGRSFTVDVTFIEPGDTVLGLALGAAAPLVLDLRVPSRGTFRFTIEFEPISEHFPRYSCSPLS